MARAKLFTQCVSHTIRTFKRDAVSREACIRTPALNPAVYTLHLTVDKLPTWLQPQLPALLRRLQAWTGCSPALPPQMTASWRRWACWPSFFECTNRRGKGLTTAADLSEGSTSYFLRLSMIRVHGRCCPSWCLRSSACSRHHMRPAARRSVHSTHSISMLKAASALTRAGRSHHPSAAAITATQRSNRMPTFDRLHLLDPAYNPLHTHTPSSPLPCLLRGWRS